jgi:predicted kinase
VSKVIILRGVPGSGKSTWVDKYDDYLDTVGSYYRVILSRDSIRAKLFGSEGAHGVDEEAVSVDFNKWYDSYLDEATKRDDMTIIIDNTNCDWSRVTLLALRARDFRVPVEIVVIDTSLDEALRRNAARDRVVPEDVIRRMHAQLQETKDWKL